VDAVQQPLEEIDAPVLPLLPWTRSRPDRLRLLEDLLGDDGLVDARELLVAEVDQTRVHAVLEYRSEADPRPLLRIPEDRTF
jgi:hypothetical protein